MKVTILLFLLNITSVFRNCYCTNSIPSASSFQILSNHLFPRTVWMFQDGDLPVSTNKMMQVTDSSLSKEWSVIHLNLSTVRDFCDISTLSLHRASLTGSQVSDYVRICVLERMGGWYFDNTMIVSSSDFLERHYQDIVTHNYQYFGVCNVQCPRKLVESSFFYVPQGSIVMQKWREELDVLLQMGQRNYIYSVYRNGTTFPSMIFTEYPEVDSYMIVFVSFQYVIERLIPRKTKINIIDGRDTLFKMHNDCKYDLDCMITVGRSQLEKPTYPIIKYNTWLRKYIWKGTTNHSIHPLDNIHPLIYGIKQIKPVTPICHWCILLFLFMLILQTLFYGDLPNYFLQV